MSHHDRAPYIGQIKRKAWRRQDGTREPRVVLYGAHGVAAALTPAEAYSLANLITDAAETIERLDNP